MKRGRSISKSLLKLNVRKKYMRMIIITLVAEALGSLQSGER